MLGDMISEYLNAREHLAFVLRHEEHLAPPVIEAAVKEAAWQRRRLNTYPGTAVRGENE